MPPIIKSQEWGIRITMTLTEEEELTLATLQDAVIVYHAGGSRKGGFNEKPHYHVYVMRDSDRNSIAEALLNNATIKKYYKASNSFWIIKHYETICNPDESQNPNKYTECLNKYWSYVWTDFPLKRQRLIAWNDSRLQLPIPENPLVIVHESLDPHQGASLTPKKNVKTSLEKQQKFLQYCKDYYEDNPAKPKNPERVIKLLYEYCKNNGFTTESCCFVWVHYALANLSTGDEYKENRAKFISRLENRFF